MMTNNNNALENIIKDFAPISLDQLNATMSLMERIDKKYIVSFDDLSVVMKKLTKDYFVLSINNNSLFTYDNIYMDTDDDLFYQLHEQQKKKRMKVRTRHYVESNLAFFECKEKKGSLTRKGRFQIPTGQALAMTDMGQSFYQGMCTSLELPYAKRKLQPSMRTLYQRITLCSKNNDERVTIDFELQVQDMTRPGAPLISMPSVAIVETKSIHKNCRSKKILTDLGYKRAKRCSKYCLGMLYTGRISESKVFAKTIKHMNKLDTRKKVVKKISKKLKMVKKSVESLARQTNPTKITKLKTLELVTS